MKSIKNMLLLFSLCACATTAFSMGSLQDHINNVNRQLEMDRARQAADAQRQRDEQARRDADAQYQRNEQARRAAADAQQRQNLYTKR